MQFGAETLLVLVAFALVAMASQQVGRLFRRINLPLITGFLLTGLLAGPSVVGLISESTVRELRFVDQMALAFIAIAAGAEIHLRELRGRLKSIAWITAGAVVAVFTLTVLTILLVASRLSFLQGLGSGAALAAALLAGSVLVARSPSSAIAIVSELRARGPFTKLVLGVTVIMDVVVVLLFAVNSSLADAILTGAPLAVGTLALVLGEVLASIALGVGVGLVLVAIVGLKLPMVWRMALLLATGYGVFYLSAQLREYTHEHGPLEVLLEPLLICMVAGFWVTNRSSRRLDLERLLDLLGPGVYVAFFTLVGAALELNALLELYPIALGLFGVRLVGLMIGNFVGGTLAGDPPRLNRVGWMAYVTQAGIGIGLAKEIAVEFGSFGESLSTLLLAVIVINQIVGPPFFKRVLRYLGEASIGQETKRRHTALIVGLDYQAVALAQQLSSHGWTVSIVTRQTVADSEEASADVRTIRVDELSAEALRQAGAADVECLILLTQDDESLDLCRIAYENFGTQQMVVRLNDHERYDEFQKLGVTVLDPSTAIVSLLDHFVRSPSSTALLLGQNTTQVMEDFVLGNRALHGSTLRELSFPLDTLVIAVHRKGEKLVCHGYTRIELGDRVSVLGSPESLRDVERRFESD